MATKKTTRKKEKTRKKTQKTSAPKPKPKKRVVRRRPPPPPPKPSRPSHPGKREIRDLQKILGNDTLAERLGVARRTIQQWSQFGPPPAQRQKLGRVVITHSERLAAEAKKSHAMARHSRRLEAPKDSQGWNVTRERETRQYKGVVSNVRTNQIISERTEEAIVHRILKEAERVEKKTGKRGKKGFGGAFYVTFGMVTFGQASGSPGKKLRSVSKGPMGGMAAFQDWASTTRMDRTTGKPAPASSIAGLEVQVRNLVHEIAKNPKGASVLDSFTVKRYAQKTEEEISQWGTKPGKKSKGKKKK